MRARFPDRAKVGAFGPGPVWAANPTFKHLSLEEPEGMHIASRAALVRWLTTQRVAAVYVNGALTYGFPETSALLSASVGDIFDVGYEGPEHSVRVLVTRPQFLSLNSTE